MNVLIACDKFKGSLNAVEVAAAVERGWRAGIGEGATSEVTYLSCPIADGGEGFVDTMLVALGGESCKVEVQDALGSEVESRYGMHRKTAILEMAEASGLWRIAEGERSVIDSSTYGTGQLIRAAVRQGAEKILLGVGGSATNDGGAGMAAALGWRFLNEEGKELQPIPRELADLAFIEPPKNLLEVEIEVACDVDNLLLGSLGATAVYGPQKGADRFDRDFLEAFLEHLMVISGQENLATIPGSGAAGGLAWGLMAFANAKLRPGFDIVAEAVSLREKVRAADWVITGEGALDEQSLQGKGPVGVARIAKEEGKKTMAVAGYVSPEIHASELFDYAVSLRDTNLPLVQLIAQAPSLIEQEVAKAVSQFC